MKKYYFVLACIFIFSCQNKTEEKEENNQNAGKIAELEKQIESNQSGVEVCNEFLLHLKDIQINIEKWVNQQSRADEKFKHDLATAEKKCDELLNNLEKFKTEKTKQSIDLANEYFKSVLLDIAEVKTLLPDFASYEDPVKIFNAMVLISPEEKFYGNLIKIQYNIEFLKTWYTKEQKKLQLEIEKLKQGS